MAQYDCYKGDKKIKAIYNGNSIIAEVFKGDELVYSHYKKDQVIFEGTSSGSFNVSLDVRGYYEITIIGASGGGNGDGETSGTNSEFAAAGAGGAGFKGIVYSKSRGNCQISVGSSVSGNTKGGDSVVVLPSGDTVIAGGGNGSVAKGNSDGYKERKEGVGGVLSPFPSSIIVSTVASGNGENGKTTYVYGSGTAYAGPCKSALYDYGITDYGTFPRTGRGVGDGYSAWLGTSGYVKIVYKGTSSY